MPTELDVAKYLHLLDGMDATREEKEEIIRTIIAFTESRLDKAFGTHPVQVVLKERAEKSKKKSKIQK